jgi:hypothetical protein
MIVTLIALLVQMARTDEQRWVGVISLPLCAGPIVLAALRVYPSAVRLGARVDPPPEQSRLARAICRDHLLCLGGIMLFTTLQLAVALR